MKVSVIVPSYNAGPYLKDALRSIHRQGYPVEIVVVDQDSDDGSTEDLGKGVRVLRTPKSSPGVARNIGLSAASGDLVAFLDADDLWPAGKLYRQIGCLLEYELSMVSGHVCYFETASEDGLTPAEGSRTETVLHVHLGACVYRREALKTLGGFDSEFLYAEDVDLLLRLRESGLPFSILRSTELYYRKHPASLMSQKNPRKESDFRLAAWKSLQRRRAKKLGPLKPFSEYLCK